jgi:hypothetical protein
VFKVTLFTSPVWLPLSSSSVVTLDEILVVLFIHLCHHATQRPLFCGGTEEPSLAFVSSCSSLRLELFRIAAIAQPVYRRLWPGRPRNLDSILGRGEGFSSSAMSG